MNNLTSDEKFDNAWNKLISQISSSSFTIYGYHSLVFSDFILSKQYNSNNTTFVLIYPIKKDGPICHPTYNVSLNKNDLKHLYLYGFKKYEAELERLEIDIKKCQLEYNLNKDNNTVYSKLILNRLQMDIHDQKSISTLLEAVPKILNFINFKALVLNFRPR